MGALSSAAPVAVAEGPATRLQGHVPVTGGIGLRFWTGGSTHGLVAEAERAGCSVLSFYVNRPGGEGGLVTYIPDTTCPATPVLLVCRPRIQGMVYDAEGDPRGGVRITAGQRYPFQHKQYETHTAADGSFDITVDRGTYWLSIGAPGASRRDAARVVRPGRPHGEPQAREPGEGEFFGCHGRHHRAPDDVPNFWRGIRPGREA